MPRDTQFEVPRFTNEQLEFIRESLIASIGRTQIVNDLVDTFDELLAKIPVDDHEEAREMLYKRVDKYYERHKPDIQSERERLAEVSGGGEDLEWDKVPISRPGYRLRMMMQMLSQTPLKALQKVATDENGRPYKVYKYLTTERLKILDAARQEVALLNKEGGYVDEDGKVQVGEGGFGDLGDSKVLGMEMPIADDEEDEEDVDTGEEAA